MANRAYLYSVDTLDAAAWDQRDRDYYDSRGAVPLAWFFFFTPSDVVRVQKDGWWEIKLAADKPTAVDRFNARLSRLQSLTQPSDLRLLAPFVDRVAGRPGGWLVLEPSEVVNDDDVALAEWSRLLAVIDDRSADPNELFGLLIRWSGYPGTGWHYEDPSELALIGYRYPDKDAGLGFAPRIPT